jgi:trimeric autotransporter adhesin
MTYTTSGNYSSVTGCVTSTLALTITPSTSNTTTATACGTYTWSVNGMTYTASGNYSSVMGCNTENLALTIFPTTNNTTTASACTSYTWSVNGSTYTTGGTYNVATGCNTETLVLTITGNPVVTASNAVVCPGGSVTLVGSPAGGMFSVANPYTGAATSFTYTYTTAGGCSASATGNITVASSAPAVITTPIVAATTTATVSWTAVPGATIYYLWYKQVGTSTWLTPTTTGTSLNLTGLNPNTTYECKIRNNNSACNQLGIFSPTVQFSTLNDPCGSATTLNPTVIVPVNKAKFSWVAVAGAAQYSVWFKLTTATTWSTALLPGTATSYTTSTLAAGTYEVKIRNRCNGVTNFTPFGAVSNFTIGTSAKGINNDELTSSISMYPNPTSDKLNVEVTATEISNTLVKVYDLTGRLMTQVQANVTVGENHIDVNMGGFANGIYTVQVYSNGQLTHVNRVRKND